MFSWRWELLPSDVLNMSNSTCGPSQAGFSRVRTAKQDHRVKPKSKYVLFLLFLCLSWCSSAASQWPETRGACGWYCGIFVWLPAAILFGAVIPRIADKMINCADICIFVPKVSLEALLRGCFAFSEGNKMCKARVGRMWWKLSWNKHGHARLQREISEFA